MPDKENGPPGQQQQQQQQHTGTPNPGNQPQGNAATGGGVAGGVATGGGSGNGARHKDTKAPPPAHQPPLQVLQLTPELFQQTVAAAVTAALAASQRPHGVQAAAAVAATPDASTPVIPRKEKKLAEF